MVRPGVFPLMPVVTSADSSVSTLTNEVSSEDPPKHPTEIEGNREGNRQLTVIGSVGDVPDLDGGRVCHGVVRGLKRPRRGHLRRRIRWASWRRRAWGGWNGNGDGRRRRRYRRGSASVGQQKRVLESRSLGLVELLGFAF